VDNLNPFKETIANPELTEADAIENIDIGGPTMLRAAAKNFQSVTVVDDPNDYKQVLENLETDAVELRKKLAAKVFRHTAQYDALIAEYFTEKTAETDPEALTLTYEKLDSLRYG